MVDNRLRELNSVEVQVVAGGWGSGLPPRPAITFYPIPTPTQIVTLQPFPIPGPIPPESIFVPAPIEH